MMGQQSKPDEEILGYLEGEEKIVIMGCGGCSTIFHTGGIKEVQEMGTKLRNEGKVVLAEIGLPFAVFCCYLPMSQMFVKENQEEFKKADAILMMSCGDGLQVIREYLDEKLGIVKPIYPANNPLGFFGGGPSEFSEECQGCGECEMGKITGICPLTQCPKGILNGPCGGTRPDGTCEVDPDKPCAWYQIYERLDEIDQLDKLGMMREPHDWSKVSRPRKLKVEPIDLHEKLAETKQVIESLGI